MIAFVSKEQRDINGCAGSIIGELCKREEFYEVHGDGVPWFLWYRELFEEAEWMMVRSLHMGTGGAGANILLDEGVQSWPDIFTVNEFLCLESRWSCLYQRMHRQRSLAS